MMETVTKTDNTDQFTAFIQRETTVAKELGHMTTFELHEYLRKFISIYKMDYDKAIQIITKTIEA